MNVHFDGENVTLDLKPPNYFHLHVVLVYLQENGKIEVDLKEKQNTCDPSLVFGDRSSNVSNVYVFGPK